MNERLAERWHVIITAERREIMVVLAELRPEADDLAGLLRAVEAWVEEESLCALRFELDGRAFRPHLRIHENTLPQLHIHQAPQQRAVIGKSSFMLADQLLDKGRMEKSASP